MRKRKPTTDVSNTVAVDEIAQNLDNQHTHTITMDRRESTAVQMEIRSDDQAQSSHPTLDESVDKAYHTVIEELISDSTKEVQKFMNIDVTDATLRHMVRQSQSDDVDIQRIQHLIGHPPNVKPTMIGPWPFNAMSYKLTNDGLLYREYMDGRVQRHQLLIPKSIRLDVLKLFHDSPLCGHLGQTRTYIKMRERFYWPNVKNTIKDNVSNCLPCKLSKHRVNLYNRPLQPT
ncbi:hypothetical protein SeLEV6574_g04089 [Synchytrium endobioticum]|uniref:Integrase zinc-binding domain-containing protein n=1 Tax=Synchytrium endobioticum TaxID=286115 RepID=A0A507D0X2_9FUNG|nr:hypothetical protein SeLEV6574_g04089 [Synchytrium endobioticum]